MTAEPTSHVPWSPDPLTQRLAGYTIEHVLALPDDAPRVELHDGVMSVVPSPTLGHQDIGNLLWAWFRRHAPANLRPGTALGVAVSVRDTLEPDVVLLRAPIVDSSHFFVPDQVSLVVEIVSPGTKRQDRFMKPGAYAAAGIPHFWRIEQDPVHVFAYDLVGSQYQPVGEATEELVLEKPFEIRLPIRDITP